MRRLLSRIIKRLSDKYVRQLITGTLIVGKDVVFIEPRRVTNFGSYTDDVASKLVLRFHRNSVGIFTIKRSVCLPGQKRFYAEVKFFAKVPASDLEIWLESFFINPFV